MQLTGPLDALQGYAWLNFASVVGAVVVVPIAYATIDITLHRIAHGKPMTSVVVDYPAHPAKPVFPLIALKTTLPAALEGL